MAGNLRAYLQLMRIPNTFTAAADSLAGYFIVSHENIGLHDLGVVLVSSSLLYTGGIVLNDLFDYEIDRRERPGRPLPSGRIKIGVAAALGWGLLISGVILPLSISWMSFAIASWIAVLVISYNRITKGIAVIGPLNMGLCRYMNFVLGMSPALTGISLKLAIPVLMMAYIIVLTVISRSEAGDLKARNLVKWMLLGIIPLDAVIAASSAGLMYGMIVMLLFIPTYVSSRILYMT